MCSVSLNGSSLSHLIWSRQACLFVSADKSFVEGGRGLLEPGNSDSGVEPSVLAADAAGWYDISKDRTKTHLDSF